MLNLDLQQSLHIFVLFYFLFKKSVQVLAREHPPQPPQRESFLLFQVNNVVFFDQINVMNFNSKLKMTDMWDLLGQGFFYARFCCASGSYPGKRLLAMSGNIFVI